MRYELFYWPKIQGRGEFVRLLLEDAGADYDDVARRPESAGGGIAAMQRLMDSAEVGHPAFAPPFLRAGRQLIGQTSLILQFLGPRHDLAPRDAAGRRWAHQLQLTLADFVAEVHDTHHPLGPTLYYEQQRPAARRRTREFLALRLPKYLDYFERVRQRNAPTGPGLVGGRIGYVDLSLAQVVAGLRYAFPAASAAALASCPGLATLHVEVFARPRLARYLASGRRLPFNQDDLFRHYPELQA